MACQSKCWSARKKEKPYKDEDKPWRKGNIYLKKKNDVMSALFNLLKETVPSRKNSEQQQL